MKIALIAPIKETVPPQKYGPIHYTIDLLAREYQKQNHQVVVYCSGDSPQGDYEKFAISDKSYPDNEYDRKIIAEKAKIAKQLAFENIMQQGDFDIVHNHTGSALFNKRYQDQLYCPLVTTIHWTLADANYRNYYLSLPTVNFVTLSHAQEQYLATNKNLFVTTIPLGLDLTKIPFAETSDNYLCFLGRIDPQKGLLDAINIALKTRQQLKIAARIDQEFKQYFVQEIAPLIDGKQIQFLGELNEKDKFTLLAHASCLLFPSYYRESFGMVIIEANACGTPVLAYDTGSSPEIVRAGINGYICRDQEDMIKQITQIDGLNRHNCRELIARNYSGESMATKYLQLFQKLISNQEIA